MSDPNYMHEFDPNRKGLCKRIIGSKICHRVEQDPVHQRYAALVQAEADHEWGERSSGEGKLSHGKVPGDCADELESALRDDVEPLVEALRKLKNEITGALNLEKDEIRRAIGNTNFAVLEMRTEQARAALAKWNGERRTNERTQKPS